MHPNEPKNAKTAKNYNVSEQLSKWPKQVTKKPQIEPNDVPSKPQNGPKLTLKMPKFSSHNLPKLSSKWPKQVSK